MGGLSYTNYDNNKLWTLTNKSSSGSVMDVYTYTYDGAGNLTSKSEIINGSDKGETIYTYDSLSRVATITEPNGKTTTYAYDEAGNRISEEITHSGSTVTITYRYNEQNRLLETVEQGSGARVTTKYAYDNNGNLLSKTTGTVKADTGSESYGISVVGKDVNGSSSYFEYDLWNRLIKSATGDKITTYAYNGEGIRVEKNVNGQVERYLYEYNNVVLEVDGAGNQLARNVYGINLISRTSDGDTVYFM
jgi:YD repeat-containing protein